MTPSTPCPRCGTLRPADATTSCGVCLLEAALPPSRSEPLRNGEEVGGYQLVKLIARGGMGVIYEAQKAGSETEPVALKMLLGGEQADAENQLRFLAEAHRAGLLKHPGIVPIHEVGAHRGAPFFTMTLMQGSLADQLSRERLDPRRSIELVARVARAIHHCHQRGILHRDLKPANLLLDKAGDAHVADFGIAKYLEQTSGLTQTGAALGTPAYMAPEQARGETRNVTPAADVYSLGAILYELLAGEAPFSAETPELLRKKVQHDEPTRLRKRVATIDPHLEAICEKCLAKAPERRYPSALALAEDLESVLSGHRPVAPLAGPLERWARWAGRHPVIVGLAVALALFGVSSAGVVILETTAQKDTLRGEVLAANVFAARAVAAAVTFELHEYGERVQRAAKDPRLVNLLGRKTGFDAAHLLDGVDSPAEHAGFDNWEVLDSNGAVLARWPLVPEQLGRRFEWRDYFQGAAALKDGLYVSRAIESVVDHRIKFALSAPIRDDAGRLLGVMSGMVATDSTLGALHFNDPNDASRTAALIAPRDRDRPDAGVPSNWVVVVHDGLTHGQPVSIDTPAIRQLAQSDASHHDPVPGYDEGLWLAGFAPVAETGGEPGAAADHRHPRLMVIVQTRDVQRQGTPTVLLEIAGLLASCAAVGVAIALVGRRRKLR